MRLPSFLSRFTGRAQTRPAGRDLLQRRFDATSGQRGHQSFGSYGPETLAGSAIISRKARYAAENNPWIANGVAAWVTALVGAGIVPTPQHPNRDARPVVQSAFSRWAAVCDLDGLTDFHGLIAAAVRSMIVSGEAFLQFVTTESGLGLRLIAPEQVDIAQTGELSSGGRIVAGVEFDADGRRVAYWVRPVDPTAIFEGYALPSAFPLPTWCICFAHWGRGRFAASRGWLPF
ncbi:MAG: phage portal protein [Sphingomonas bacterium]